MVRLGVRPDEPEAVVGPRPRGSRRPHADAKVAAVRRLIEQTALTYAEIAARTGVGRASICRWTRDGGWQRPVFAPRATDTVPSARASARLQARTLAARLRALAERYIRELEESASVDLDQLAQALELLKMTGLAARPRRRRRPGADAAGRLSGADTGSEESASPPFVPAQKREARLHEQAGTQGPQAHEQVALGSRHQGVYARLRRAMRGNEREEGCHPFGIRSKAFGEPAPAGPIEDLRAAARIKNSTARPRESGDPAEKGWIPAYAGMSGDLRASAIEELRAAGVNIERAPPSALADFVSSRAPPRDEPTLRRRGHRSKRNREHARMLERYR
jgi:hypothetical protein